MAAVYYTVALRHIERKQVYFIRILYTYKKRLSAKQILLAVAVSHWLKFAVAFWVVAFGKNFLLKRTSLKFKGPLLVHSASSAVEALYGYL